MLGSGCKIGLRSMAFKNSFELKLTLFLFKECLFNEPRRREDREVQERREKGNIADRSLDCWVCEPEIAKLSGVEPSIEQVSPC
jgi:hypothetical protein